VVLGPRDVDLPLHRASSIRANPRIVTSRGAAQKSRYLAVLTIRKGERTVLPDCREAA